MPLLPAAVPEVGLPGSRSGDVVGRRQSPDIASQMESHMHRVIVIALACGSAVGVVSTVCASAAGPTTRTVYVTVVDDQGGAVPGLSLADFVVKEGGKEREVASVTPASEKMRLALLQQVADDLSSQYLIEHTLPEGVRPSDRISVSLEKPGATLRAPSRVSKK